MIGTLIGIVITLIILGVVWWAIQALLPLIPLPDPFRQIINILLILILVIIVIWVILTILGSAGIHVPMFHGMLDHATKLATLPGLLAS